MANTRFYYCLEMTSRGIDVPDTSHVIMLAPTPTTSMFTKRVVSRNGRPGKVIVFTRKSEDCCGAPSNEIGIDIVKRQLKPRR